MIEVRQTVHFTAWLNGLADVAGRKRIASRIDRVAYGLMGDVKPVGDGVFELRMDFGPGYRVYFTKQGEAIILLLVGGDKSSQRRDIKDAKAIAKEL